MQKVEHFFNQKKPIMHKISIKNIVEFKRKKSENSKRTLINNLKSAKPKNEEESGGDYWIHSVSTISTVFRTEENERVRKKIDIIKDKKEAATAKISKDMFSRNIDILHNFEDINFSDYKPKPALRYLSKPQYMSVLKVRNVPIQVLPNHVFTFKEKNVEKIGAIWFVSKLGGYSTQELGMFTDSLYRYLTQHYSKEYTVSADHCLTVDVATLNEVNYAQIMDETIQSDLNSTLDSISKML
ncbi:MAG: hypothetical protein K0Q79_506 [Flavipsychrobacter sp.]|jgi:hypothetical protein|nr:hypothetical protein [Flavipsychrobacter sp.]